MKMTPQEISKFIHGTNASYSANRKWATMFGKIWNFNPFAESSGKQQEKFGRKKQTGA